MPLTKQDKKIIQKIIRQDESTLIAFYNKYRKHIFHFINKQLNNAFLAEELTQDTFFDFIESVRNFRAESSLKTFLFSIAKHKTIDTMRKKQIKKILFSHLPFYIVERLSTIILDDEIEKKELAKKIKNTFKKLPNDYSLILRLKYIEETGVREIAKKLSLTFKATESLLFRARKAFAKIFNNLP